MSAATAGGLCRKLMQLGLALLVACSSGETPDQSAAPPDTTLSVFTTVAEPPLEELLGGYARHHGVQLSVTHGDLQSFHQMTQTEGHSPDLFVAGSIPDLTLASRENVLRPFRSALVLERIPQAWRDPEKSWTALAVRGRGVVLNPVLVAEPELASISGFASLADDRWRDRLCLSSSSVAGNRSLIARLIRDHGERQAEIVVRGWRDNLAQPVYADDAQLLQAIADGSCAIGIAGFDKLARLIDADQTVNLRPHRFADPDQAHVELSGAGVTRHARHPEQAAAMLELLIEAEANAKFAAMLYALPANPRATISIRPHLRGQLPADGVNAAELGFLLEDAVRLAERARYP